MMFICCSTRAYDSHGGAVRWKFMSVHNWKEEPYGEWTISLNDTYGYSRKSTLESVQGLSTHSITE